MKKAKKEEKARGTETNVSEILTKMGVDPSLNGDELRSALIEKFGSEKIADHAMGLMEEYERTGSNEFLMELYKMQGYAEDKEKLIANYGEDGKVFVQKIEANPTAESIADIKILNIDATKNLYPKIESAPKEERLEFLDILVKVSKDPHAKENKEELERLFDLGRKLGLTDLEIEIAMKAGWCFDYENKRGNEEAAEEYQHATTLEEIEKLRKKHGTIDQVTWEKGCTAISYAKESHDEGEKMDQPIQNMLNSLQFFYDQMMLSDEERELWETVSEKMKGDGEWASRLDDPTELSNYLKNELVKVGAAESAIELEKIIAGVAKVGKRRTEEILKGNKSLRLAVLRALKRCAEE